MIKYKDKIIPFSLIFVGLYMLLMTNILDLRYEFTVPLSQILVLLGILIFGFREIQKRLGIIESELQIDRKNKISNIKLTSGEITNEFLAQIKRKRYIYKASIYLPKSNIENLFLLKSILSNTKIDSTFRILLNSDISDELSVKNLKDIIQRYGKHIEVKETDLDISLNYIIIVLDTQVWVVNDYGETVNQKLLFNTSSYDSPGKSFIDFFNSLWEKANRLNLVKNG